LKIFLNIHSNTIMFLVGSIIRNQYITSIGLIYNVGEGFYLVRCSGRESILP